MARAAEPKIDRRAAIAKALYDCISKQGYASTSLTDVADQAKMSPSHVGYYFDNKAAILEYYSVGLCERILDGLPDLEEGDAERLADGIASFCFGGGQLNTAFLGVIQEISGLAVHDARLLKIKSDHATAWRQYFEAFFERTAPSHGLTPGEAARLAHAMLVGLDTNTLFDRGLSRETAQELFHRALRALAGLDVAAIPRANRAPTPRRQRSVTRSRKGVR